MCVCDKVISATYIRFIIVWIPTYSFWHLFFVNTVVFPLFASFLFFMLSLELCRCPLIFSCPADHEPAWRPRIILFMVEAPSVNNVKDKYSNTVPNYSKILFYLGVLQNKL